MVYKCRMCGGDIIPNEDRATATCPFCGTLQTIPRIDNERRERLYSQANLYLRQAEYDRAARTFEKILEEDNNDPEAHWSLALCRYGVVYVEDPATHEWIPTCNRTYITSILADENYLKAMELGSDSARALYREQAERINEIQKRIRTVAAEERPYDVFICYKEKDAQGDRTRDSVLAQDLYDQLTSKGLRVFFARITLEQKIGKEYEPYIYAALISAKVMVVVGTKAEYFNAPWVRNEWSRYLTMMQENTDKHIIPAYCDMDAYDIPREMQNIQAVDLGKIGATQDLVRGIKNLASSGDAASNGEPAAGRFLRLGLNYLESEDFMNAAGYFDRHLENYPNDYEGWWGKVRTQTDDLKNIKYNKLNDRDLIVAYSNALRYAPEDKKEEMRKQIRVLTSCDLLNAENTYQSCNEKYTSLTQEKSQLDESSSATARILEMKKEQLSSYEKAFEKKQVESDKMKVPEVPVFLLVIGIFSLVMFLVLFKDFRYDPGFFVLVPMMLIANISSIILLISRRKESGKKKKCAVEIAKIQEITNNVKKEIIEDNGVLQKQLKRIKDIEQYIPEIKMDIDVAEKRVNWFKRIQAM